MVLNKPYRRKPVRGNGVGRHGQCQGAGSVNILPLTSRSTGRQKRTAFGSLRWRSGAGYLRVSGCGFGPFGLRCASGLGAVLGCQTRIFW